MFRSAVRVSRIWGEEYHYTSRYCLAKTLVVRGPLSVQVHPRKWETWSVVSHDPRALLYLGFRPSLRSDLTQGSIRQAVEEGRLLQLLVSVPAEVGMTIVIPPGCVHMAMGEQLVLHEVQPFEDETYRLFDWGRPRPLHIGEALTCLDIKAEPLVYHPVDTATRSKWETAL